MSLEFELYEEKRRKMRRFSFFKGILVTLIITGVTAAIWNRDLLSYPHIATYNVVGEIYDDPSRDSILREIAEDDNAYGLLLKINSPGGTVVGAEALYESLKNISDKKPVVVTIGEVGASAAYLVALAGDKIFARGNSLIGSIGVIVQYPDLSKLAEVLGISMQVVKSGEAKGGTNFFEPMNENIIKNQEVLVNDSFVWFKELVSQRRKLNGLELDKISKGQLFTGRMAVELGLIDAIGSSDQAIKYFQSQGPEFKGVGLVDWTLKKETPSFWSKFLSLGHTTSIANKLKFMQSPRLFSIAS